MMSINDILRYGEQTLADCTPDFRIDAKLLLEEVLDCNSTFIFMHRDDELTQNQESKYKAYINRRLKGEPTQYILGHQAFMGLEFEVEEGVLIPRSDTEPLVEAVLERLGSARTVLDIGAGSGAIHVSLLHYRKELLGTAVDISDTALKVASQNAKRLGVSDRMTYYKSDVFEALEGKTFDVIVSNPPYIPTKVIDGLQTELSFEPRIALDGGTDGYDFYRRIIKESRDYFNDAGLIAFEVGHDQSQTVKELLEEAGYINVEILKDLSQIERVVLARYER